MEQRQSNELITYESIIVGMLLKFGTIDNVDFDEDNNYSLDRYVIRNLDKYDIIIASNLNSERLFRMGSESTEQCKDTGRELTLLVTYKDLYFEQSKKHLDDGVILAYVFAGNCAPSYECHTKDVSIL